MSESEANLLIERAGPMVTVQAAPRKAVRALGLAGSGPMDEAGFIHAGALANSAAEAGIECAGSGFSFVWTGDLPLRAGWAGGRFAILVDGVTQGWPGGAVLAPGARVEVGPASEGNWGYLRFSAEIDVPRILGSRATHAAVGMGGLEGRMLAAGDRLPISILPDKEGQVLPERPTFFSQEGSNADEAIFPVLWGLHARLFTPAIRHALADTSFRISARMDRMGVQLIDEAGLLTGASGLSLVSDATVPGDIQILGDGTPVVLMREAQPTGGYPRIATLARADLDRFAQMRPGRIVRFIPRSLVNLRALGKERA